jgi:hypothetical protein
VISLAAGGAAAAAGGAASAATNAASAVGGAAAATVSATVGSVQTVGATLGLVRDGEDPDAPLLPSDADALAPAPSLTALLAGGVRPASAMLVASSELADVALEAWRVRFEVLLGVRANRAGYALLSAQAALNPPFPSKRPAALRSARGAALLDGAMARVEQLLSLAATAIAWPERTTDAQLLAYAQKGLAAEIEALRGVPCVGEGGGGGGDDVQAVVDGFIDASLAAVGARTERAQGYALVDGAIGVRNAGLDRAAKVVTHVASLADGGTGIVRTAKGVSDGFGAGKIAMSRGIAVVASLVPGAGTALMVAGEVEQLNEREKVRKARLAQRAVFTPLAYEAYLVLLRILGIVAREEGAAVAARGGGGGGGGGGAAAVPECSAAGDGLGAAADAKGDAGAVPAGDALSAVP